MLFLFNQRLFCKFFYISYLHFLLNGGKVMAQIMWKAKIEKI